MASHDRVKRNLCDASMITSSCGKRLKRSTQQSQPIRMTVVVFEYLFPPGAAYPTSHYIQQYHQEISGILHSHYRNSLNKAACFKECYLISLCTDSRRNSNQKVTRIPVNLPQEHFTHPYNYPALLEHHHSENTGAGFIVFIEDYPGGFTVPTLQKAPEPLLQTYRNLRTGDWKSLLAKCCTTGCTEEEKRAFCDT